MMMNRFKYFNIFLIPTTRHNNNNNNNNVIMARCTGRPFLFVNKTSDDKNGPQRADTVTTNNNIHWPFEINYNNIIIVTVLLLFYVIVTTITIISYSVYWHGRTRQMTMSRIINNNITKKSDKTDNPRCIHRKLV